MADTAIEWADKVWNPLVGCSVFSPGCTNCYAMKMAGRLETMSVAHEASHGGDPGPMAHYRGTTQKTRAGYVWTGKIGFNEQALLAPLRWKKPARIFVNSMSDLFHEGVTDEQIDRIFAVMALCPQHTFQVLTKRADRMREYFAPDRYRRNAWPDAVRAAMQALKPERIGGMPIWPLPNVWLGVSVENQQAADERIPHLLATPAALRWISAEPLLGPVDLNHIRMVDYITDAGAYVQGWESALTGKRFDEWSDGDTDGWPKLDWVVCGGESGKHARPMHPDWARSLRDQCAAAGVPFFFKQWGDWWPLDQAEREWDLPRGAARDLFLVKTTEDHAKIGKKRAGRLLDGTLHDAFPVVQP